MDRPTQTLDELRRRLDAIDDRIHDLVMERAAVVEQVGTLKQSSGQPSLRPGREAAILRRLLSRHRGRFPQQSLVRLWRELLGGAVAIQGAFRVAVPDGFPGLWDLARDHFGGVLPVSVMPTAADILLAVEDGRASVGVLPMPSDRDDAPWWPLLAARRGQGPRVVARLPLVDRGNGRGQDDALVVAAANADTTADDRTLLVIAEAKTATSARLASVLARFGPRATEIAMNRHAPAETWHLVEFDGIVAADDPHLADALSTTSDGVPQVWPLGFYARPLPRENT